MRASKQQLKRLGKKGLSLLMAMSMCLSLIQISAFADTDIQIQTENQISNAWDGDTVSYTGTGAVTTGSDWAVQLSRTLEATGSENLFNVNMTVVTKNSEVHVSNKDAAVVLVLDTSGSMGYCSECGSTSYHWSHTFVDNNGNGRCDDCGESVTNKNHHEFKSRLTAAQEAANAFLDGYAEVANAGTRRYVSLVTFGGNASAQPITESNYWVNVSDTTDVTDTDLTNAKNTITNLSAGGGTNTEGGFQLAYNLLKRNDLPAGISNKYVIFLSDGEPTYHLNGTNSTTAMSFDGVKGGGSWSMKSDWQDLKPIADQITSTGSNGGDASMYSLLYGDTANATLYKNDNYNSGADSTYPNVAALFNAFNKRPATDNILTPTTSDQLRAIFMAILNSQETSGSQTNGISATIGEVIGGTSHAYTFIGFNNADGSGLVLNGGTPASSYNGASVTSNALDWDLSTAQSETDGPANTTTYRLSYQVRLNNDVSGFQDWRTPPHTEYSVGDASLTYTYTAPNGTVTTPTKPFPTIKAHGYLGAFDFMKVARHTDEDENLIYLPGAQFLLSSLAYPALNRTDGAIQVNATSEGNAVNETLGRVPFVSIPSGYSYLMSETAEFTVGTDVYEPTEGTRTVTVAYGQVSGAPTGNVVNQLKQKPITLELTKQWILAAGRTTQPITVYLDRNGVEVATLTLNGSQTMSSSDTNACKVTAKQIDTATWVYNLQVPSINQAAGGLYTYSVREAAMPGIDSTVADMVITNTTGKTAYTVEKLWSPIDGKDVSSSMPQVTVDLLRRIDGGTDTVAETVTLGAGAGQSWSHTWNNLLTHDQSGNPYIYTAQERPGNYSQAKAMTTDGNKFTFYNHATNAEISKTVQKVWNDDGTSARPDIEVVLTRSDNVTDTHTLTNADATTPNGNTWSYTFTNLPTYKVIQDPSEPTGYKLETYTYTLSEVTEVDGYTPSTWATGENGIHKLVNTRTQDVVIEVEKTWLLENGSEDDKFTHDPVLIELYRNDLTAPIASESTNDSGVARFETYVEGGETKNLPQFGPDGKAYTYTVKEADSFPNYTTTVDYGTGNTAIVFDDDSVGYATVKNTLNEIEDNETSVKIFKKVLAPSETEYPSIIFTLAQAKEDGTVVEEYTHSMTSGSYTFENLPIYYYDQGSKDITDDDGNVIGTEPEVVQREYQYTVTESANGYYNNGAAATAVWDDENDQWVFTNVRTGTIDLAVNKVWNDLGPADRPTVTIYLKRAVNPGPDTTWDTVGTFTPTGDTLSHTWTAQDEFDNAGQRYTYIVEESPAAGYDTTYTGSGETTNTYSDTVNSITVTNKLTHVNDHSFNASKTWQDGSNVNNTRESITLNVLQNDASLGTIILKADGTRDGGTYMGAVEITKDGSDKWNLRFTGLSKYYEDSNGQMKAYDYTVTETLASGSRYTESGVTNITNTLMSGSTEVKLTKLWFDPVGTQHTEGVLFSLTAKNANGVTVTQVAGTDLPTGVTLGFNPGDTLPQGADGNDLADNTVDLWHYTFTNLPQYDDNHSRITYTVAEETDLPGYVESTKENAPNTFINTIEPKDRTLEGQKIWNMSQKTDDDEIRPDPQDIKVGLFTRNGNNDLHLFTLAGLTNPVTVSPTVADGSIKGSFSFPNVPTYDAIGHVYQYEIREVKTTTGEGEETYTPIPNNGTLTLKSADGDFAYDYTVTYSEGNTVTNTYSDPNVYFYKIIGNYYTNVSGSPGGSVLNVPLKDRTALTVAERDALDNYTRAVTADELTAYATHGGNLYEYDTSAANVESVELDEVNRMYTIELNYVRNLYTLAVNYVFPEGDKPAGDTYKDYVDPGYLGNAGYTANHKSAPTGFQLYKVTVKDSAADERNVNDVNYQSGTFANHDVTVTYHYSKVVSPDDDVRDASFTIHKNDAAREENRLITGSAATFQLFTDEDCAQDAGKALITTAAGMATVSAKALGTGTFFMKEVQAPTGYAAGSTVWQIDVSKQTAQEIRNGQFVNVITWGIAVKVVDAEASALDEGNILNVDNTRQYGYLNITKVVSGMPENESRIFKFIVTGPDGFNEPVTITANTNGTFDLTAPLAVPTGTYVVTEDSSSAGIGGGYSVNISYSSENGAVTVTNAHTSESPANVTVTNTYTYSPDNVIIHGQKVWDDDGNRDGKRPISIRVQLFYGQEEGPAVRSIGLTPIPSAFVDVSADMDRAFSISYDSNKYPGPITMKEVGYTDANGIFHDSDGDWVTPLPGYQTSYELSEAGSTIITNTHEPETIFISAEKVWASGTAQPVTLRLSANSVEKAVLVLDGTEDDNEFAPWIGEFPGAFPKYENGALINYSVTEDALGSGWSYTTDKETRAEGDYIYGYDFTVTNSYTGGGGGDSYYYRIDYVYTGYGADGSTTYSDTVTGSVQATGRSTHSFTPADTASRGGYAFSLTSEANPSASLAGTSRSNPHVFTVYYEFTQLEDGETPTGETPDPGPDQPIDIPEGEVPKADVPPTGDSLALWIMAAAVSGLGLVWLSITGRKRREDENV